MSSTVKASLVVVAFAAVALWSFLFLAPPSSLLYAHAIFFAILLVNTFFSIRLYAAIQPDDAANRCIDGVLVVTYLMLALALGRPFGFAVSALFLFIAAPVKYALMLGKIPHAALLREKILIDSLGTVSAAALLAATLAGYAASSAWILAILFALANAYLLLVNQMYPLRA